MHIEGGERTLLGTYITAHTLTNSATCCATKAVRGWDTITTEFWIVTVTFKQLADAIVVGIGTDDGSGSEEHGHNAD